MFRNGPEVDGGDTAYLGPTTIIEMTIPMSQSFSDATLDDSWVLAGPITDNHWYNSERIMFFNPENQIKPFSIHTLFRLEREREREKG